MLYIDFLKEVISNLHLNTKFYTSNRTRTIGTLLYRLKGMYSILNVFNETLNLYNKKTIEQYDITTHEKLLNEPNIKMYDFKNDHIFFTYYNCIESVANELNKTDKYQKLSKELEKFKNEHYDLIEPFKEYGKTYSIIDTFLYIADYLDRANEINIELTGNHQKLKSLLNGLYYKSIKAISYSWKAIRIIGSGFYRKLRKYIDNARKVLNQMEATDVTYKKLLIYSGHDMNFSVLLSFLKVDLTDLIFEFNSELIFELYQDFDNLFASNFYLTVKFEGNPLPLAFCDFKIQCDSQVFIDFIDINIFKQKDVDDFCNRSKNEL